MGAWSGEPFGNDAAADFAWELDDEQDWKVVSSALDDVLRDDGTADADVASIAIAAAEVVAHALGRPTQSDTYTESVQAFVERAGRPDAELVTRAQRALAAATSPDGELTGLWDEADPQEWRDANERLADSLEG